MSAEIIAVEISEQPIALCKLLKIANLVAGGGEAKILIASGYVKLNQQVEYQKRKKVYDQDMVEYDGEVLRVICKTPALIPTKSKVKLAKQNVKQNHLTPQHNQADNSKIDELKPKRKPISF